MVEGSVRARQERRGDAQGRARAADADSRRCGLRGPGRRHGDAAAVAGARLLHRRHRPHHHQQPGWLHDLAIRATRARRIYCSDVAKMLEAPIFHVNARRSGSGGVRHASRAQVSHAIPQGRRHRSGLLSPSRPQRGRRAGGHAAGDVPGHPQASDRAQALCGQAGRRGRAHRGRCRRRWSSSIATGLDEGTAAGARLARHDRQQVHGRLEHVRRRPTGPSGCRPASSCARLRVARRAHRRSIPADFTLHPRVAQVMANRKKMLAGELPLDWGCAETLAYASAPRGWLLGPPHRPGQRPRHLLPSPRGAARSEHATRRYVPLQHIADHQPRVQVIDSVLSEEAVMGFEYGYSTTEPQCARHLGRPVRRLRQRRAGHHRPVHQLGRGQVGALLRPRAVPAARLRRRRARSIPPRASSASCSCAPSTTCRCACRRRRRRCSTCCAGRCCSRFRKPLIVMTPKSLLRHELSVSLARGSDPRQLRARDRRDRRSAAAQVRARRVLQRQGVLRSAEGAAQGRHARRRAGAHRAALSVSRRRSTRRSCASIRTRARSSGARKSRRTRAPGTRSAIACRSRSAAGAQVLYAGRAPAAAPATGIAQDPRSRAAGADRCGAARHQRPKTRRGRPRA